MLFLLSLDEEVAAPIVNELGKAELSKLRAVASTMREVRPDAVDDLYREFLEKSSSAVAVPRGGLPYLRRLTAGALGEERAREVFEDGVTSPLARLEAARAMPGIAGAEVWVPVGGTVHPLTDGSKRAGHVLAYGLDRDDAAANASRAAAAIRIVTEPT